jgi:hypothetical protein
MLKYFILIAFVIEMLKGLKKITPNYKFIKIPISNTFINKKEKNEKNEIRFHFIKNQNNETETSSINTNPFKPRPSSPTCQLSLPPPEDDEKILKKVIKEITKLLISI